MTVAEARRRARAAYKERRAAEGIKQVNFALAPAAREALAVLTMAHGGQDRALDIALRQTEALRRYGLTEHQQTFLREEGVP